MKKKANHRENNNQIFFLRLLLLLLPLGSGQLCFAQKITKATQQKTFAGMGGVFMNYLVEFKSPKGIMTEIDSVISVADASSIKFGFTRFDPCCKNQISFGYALSQSPKCKTCPDVAAKQQNITKGVMIYGRKGEKKFVLKVKKFKQLPDLYLP